MRKTILIVTDNLPEQINGVVTTYKNIEACAIRDNYRVVYLDPGRFRYVNCPRYNEVKITLARKRTVGKVLKEINPDYIHIATEGPLGLCARQYLDQHNLRYNTAYHTKFPEGIRKLFGIPEGLTWPLMRWFHKHSGKVLTTTETMVKDLRDHGFDGDIIPWTRGVDREIFNPSYRIPNDSMPLRLVCVSRVSKEKNLEAFCELDYPNSTKVIIGDGPYRKELEKKYPDVLFLGFKRGKELAHWYANADVFVFPSRWETFGIVMIEAMACGTPVAAFPADGPKDVIDESVTGFMDEDLATAVHRCLGLSRDKVLEGSKRWSWENAWVIFRDNLVSKT
jgi:glycosyltransferase involved in cell wall biosynthesis